MKREVLSRNTQHGAPALYPLAAGSGKGEPMTSIRDTAELFFDAC
jgi:hypothetical protein